MKPWLIGLEIVLALIGGIGPVLVAQPGPLTETTCVLALVAGASSIRSLLKNLKVIPDNGMADAPLMMNIGPRPIPPPPGD
jgi:hypothetical protein